MFHSATELKAGSHFSFLVLPLEKSLSGFSIKKKSGNVHVAALAKKCTSYTYALELLMWNISVGAYCKYVHISKTYYFILWSFLFCKQPYIFFLIIYDRERFDLSNSVGYVSFCSSCDRNLDAVSTKFYIGFGEIFYLYSVEINMNNSCFLLAFLVPFE